MPVNPNIIANSMSTMASNMPDVNALMQQQMTGLQNINTLERQRRADALELEDRALAAEERAAAASASAAKEQEAAIIKALLPAYSYGIQTGDIFGAGSLVPPEMRGQLQPFIDALAGQSPEQVRAALIGSLASSPEGQAALGAIQRAQTTEIQLGQLDLSRGRLEFDIEQANKPPVMTPYQQEQIELARGRLNLDIEAANEPPAMTPYQEAQLELERERLAIEKAERDARARGEIGPTEAQKGEVWNEEQQRYDVVPGTKLYRESAAKHTEDFKAKTAVQDRVAESLAKIDYVLADENKDGFEYNFGGYYAAYAGQYMPVEQAQDVKNTIESLKADITNAGLELMRSGGSIGAITEREWPLLEKQIAAVTPYVGEKRARELLQNVAQRLRNIQSRATQAYDQQWGDTQFYETSEALPVGDGEEDLPEGTTSSNW